MIVGNYELKRCIGIGYFGEIYLGNSKNENNIYSIERIDREKIEKDKSFQYLNNDFKFLKLLNHPNIIKLVETVKTRNHYYMVKEYFNGGSLASELERYIIKNGKTFSEKIIQYLMNQIIDAIKYIHENKIIVRHINIENIFLHYDNEEDRQNLNLMKAKIKFTEFCFAIKNKNAINLNCNNILNDDTETIIMRDLKTSKQHELTVGKKSYYDIRSIGEICFKIIFIKLNKDIYKSDLNDYSEIINDSFSDTLMISQELISFMNSMMICKEFKRPSASKLSKHDFLTKEINQLNKIYLKYDSEIKINLEQEDFLREYLENHIITPLDIEINKLSIN